MILELSLFWYLISVMLSAILYTTFRCNFLNKSHCIHDDVIQWKHFPRYWPFVRGIHRSPVNSPHKGQWRGALVFSLICAWINGWVNNRGAGDSRRHCAHYDVTVIFWLKFQWSFFPGPVYNDYWFRSWFVAELRHYVNQWWSSLLITHLYAIC